MSVPCRSDGTPANAGEDAISAPRIERTLNKHWRFCYDPEPVAGTERAAADHDTRDFLAIGLPHTWHTYETTAQMHPFIRNPSEVDNPYWWRGWGWYRKRFHIDRRHAGRRVFLEFDGVQKFSRVYCNGRDMAQHAGGFNTFSVDITDAVRWGEENVLTVAVSARRDDDFGHIPPMTAGNWNTYGGIYRDVRLVLKHPVHIPFQGSADYDGGTFVTTPEVSRDQAKVQVITHLRNEESSERRVTVRQRIVDPDGKIVAEFEAATTIAGQDTTTLTQDSPVVVRPRLWSPESPALYTLQTAVLGNGKTLDTLVSPLGFRWFRWDNQTNTLYLNDERVRITGMNRHQEYPWLGDAIPKRFHEMDLRDMRENLGINFARWCHYTQDKFVYDWCDRNGILVCEEVPNIKDLPFGSDIQQRQVVEMIRRDRNHPCIIMWSMGNETDNAADGRWACAEDNTRIIHYRKVTGPTPASDHSHLQLDMENLLRCTVRGWWESDAMDPECVPLPSDHENGQVTGSEAWQHAAARIRDGSIRGRIDDDTVVWIYADHGADREYRHCPLKHINPKGWVDAYRQPKQIYWLWQANRTQRLMAHARDYWWRPAHLGTLRDIVVDSNGDTVELFVGNERLGKQRPGPDNFFSVIFRNVPVRDADLRIVARRGSETVTHLTPMCGAPAALRLRSWPACLTADRADIALITVDVVDDNGVSVIGARPPVRWNIEGPGALLAPADMVTDIDQREAMDGTMYTIMPLVMPVRAGSQPGKITVSVSAFGLRSARIGLECRPAGPSPNDGIVEPSVENGGLERLRQQRRDAERISGGDAESFPRIDADIHIDATDRDGIRRELWHKLGMQGSRIETALENGALMERLIDLTLAGNGVLIADDINFHLRQ